MSARGASIGSIILGVGLAALSIAFPPAGAGFWFYAGASVGAGVMVAGGALGLVMGVPRAASVQDARAGQLEIATAGDGFPVTVVFGEQRVVGNFMNYSLANFEAREVRNQTPPGGKGGGGGGGGPAPVIGYEYFLAYEYGLCMGPIDQIGQVFSVPGEFGMRQGATEDDPPSWATFSGDYVDLTFAGKNEGGTVRVYQGNSSQTRISTNDPYAFTGMNYRNMAWAMFGASVDRFQLGRNPGPKTYAFLIRRLPVVERDDTTTISGFKTRGSSDSGHAMYWQANPIAALYEIITNKLWGAALSSDLIDEASWITASEWFESRNIGMSFKVEAGTSLTDLMDDIKRHTKCLVAWDGDTLKLRNLLDLSLTHGAIQTLRDDEVNDLRVQRPSWEQTQNEVRAEFNSSHKNFKPDVVHMSDQANQTIQGRIKTHRVQFGGFTEWNVARKMALRVLQEVSYPLATAVFEMNRYKSQLEVGDVFRLIWKEWGTNSVTAYFVALAIEDGDNDDEAIKVTAMEEVSLPMVDGEETSVATPDKHPWEDLQDLTEAEIYLHTDGTDAFTDDITPSTVWELSPIRTGGAENRIAILGEKGNPALIGIRHHFSQVESYQKFPWIPAWPTTDKRTSFNLGDAHTFAITGTLLTAIDGYDFIDRSAAGFEFQLTNDTLWEATLLSNASTITDDMDDMEELTLLDRSFMILGDEIIQIGAVTKLAANHYRARHFIRGKLGTPIQPHAISATFYFLEQSVDGRETGEMTIGRETEYIPRPVGTGGEKVSSGAWTALPGTGKFLGRGVRPLAPTGVEYGVEGAGIATVRPRFFDRGVDVQAFQEAMDFKADDLAGMTFAYQRCDDAGDPITVWSWQFSPQYGWGYSSGPMEPVPTSFTFEPSDGLDPSKGVAHVTAPLTGGDHTNQTTPTCVKIYARLNGRDSIDAARFNL